MKVCRARLDTYERSGCPLARPFIDLLFQLHETPLCGQLLYIVGNPKIGVFHSPITTLFLDRIYSAWNSDQIIPARKLFSHPPDPLDRTGERELKQPSGGSSYLGFRLAFGPPPRPTRGVVTSTPRASGSITAPSDLPMKKGEVKKVRRPGGFLAAKADTPPWRAERPPQAKEAPIPFLRDIGKGAVLAKAASINGPSAKIKAFKRDKDIDFY